MEKERQIDDVTVDELTEQVLQLIANNNISIAEGYAVLETAKTRLSHQHHEAIEENYGDSPQATEDSVENMSYIG